MARARLSMFICYKDPDAMVEWLQRGFGFTTVRSFPDEQTGKLIHAELRLGDAVIAIQADNEGYDVPRVRNGSVGRGPYVVLGSNDEIDAMHKRAVAAGGTSLIAPEETQWGNYRCDVIDPEGTQWSFGTYMPGQEDAGNW